MAKKTNEKYRYDTYGILNKNHQPNNQQKYQQQPQHGIVIEKEKSNKTTEDKTKDDDKDNGGGCCTCSKSALSFWTGLITNLGVCALLLAYTLLGSFIFLGIEGEASSLQSRTASSNRHLSKPSSVNYNDFNFTYQQSPFFDTIEVRQRTVDSIWNITLYLNILYKDNWTRLAALEIARFQDQLIKRLKYDSPMSIDNIPPTNDEDFISNSQPLDYEWSFARAFLYSLTLLTTIGYGNIAPRTTLGRFVSLAYSLFGIPLTLVYLSSTGGVLASVARGVFSKVLCCCLCSNCGYCCYDEKRMAEKERRMKKKRQQMELKDQQVSLQDSYYISSGSLGLQSPAKIQLDFDSWSLASRTSIHGLSLLAPILLCISMMIIYIIFGAVTLHKLEGWSILDGVYFCFMSLSTIGFGDMMPGLRKESPSTTWFCSIYIMSGMALTAMCFNVLYVEIIHRIKHAVGNEKNLYLSNSTSESVFSGSSSKNGSKNENSNCYTTHSDYTNMIMDQEVQAIKNLPEVLDNVPDIKLYPQVQKIMIKPNLLTGVYTLPEESELEIE